MAKFDLKAYARQGAAAKVAELSAELVAIYAVFPDVGRGTKASPAGRSVSVVPCRRLRRQKRRSG